MRTRRNQQFLWLTLTAAVLMGFSFAAGYGLRALVRAVHQGGLPGLLGSMSAGSDRALVAYPRIASRAGAETMVGHGPVFGEVIQHLKDMYVEPLPPPATLSAGAVEGMLASLQDTNTRLLGPKEWSAVTDEAGGTFRGLGAVVTVRKHLHQDDQGNKGYVTQITIVAPMPGSPAEKAGLQPGDRITTIDGHWIAPTHYLKRTLNVVLNDDEDYEISPVMKKARAAAPDDDVPNPPSAEDRKKAREATHEAGERWRNSLDLEGAMELLTDGGDGEHTILYERDGVEKPAMVKLQFARMNIAPIAKKKLAPTVGYLQVRQINAEAVRALDDALAEFRASGLKSLVLDLRRTPGGSLAQAQELASRFLPGGSVAVLEKRDNTRKLVKQPLGVKPVERRARFTSIAVLVDGGTAGTAEVIAESLREAGIAKLVGQTTFGDGTEQTIFPLDDGGAVSMTTAKMLTRKGVDFDGKGLKPDVLVPASAGTDRALEQALHVVRSS